MTAGQAVVRPATVDTVRQLQRFRRWGLAIADATSIGIGVLVADQWNSLSGGETIWALVAVPIWILVAKINNLYDRDSRRIRHSTLDELPEILATAAITIAAAWVVTGMLDAHLTSSVMVVIGTVAFFVAIFLRSLIRSLYRRVAPPERTLVIGSGPKARLVSMRLLVQGGDHLDLVGYVGATEGGEVSGPASAGARYCGAPDDLSEIASAQRVNRVVIADDELSARAVGEIIAVCRGAHVSVTMVPANQAVLGPGTELNRIAEVPMLDFQFGDPPRSTMAIKRSMDLIVSMSMLTLTAPVLAVAALAIRLDSAGPVFFRQIRVGRDGREFIMYKLRTMIADAEEQLDSLIDLDALDEPAFKIADDPRVTRVGRLLRRSSFDEVPQFINVLKGDMSLVGPRPEEEAVVALYDERQRQRLRVKPGLTGPMQVAGRGGLNFEERLALERDYVDNLTITGDIKILLRTPRAVIRGDGAF
ncbi:MAG: sugar transferase [Solirubrobacterales bacterium]|nr:sugar transferase [Solirubrobacterales bacterium]